MDLLEKYQKKMIDIQKGYSKNGLLENHQQYLQNCNQEEPHTEVARQEPEAGPKPKQKQPERPGR